MTLWFVLLVMNLVMPLTGAISAAHHLHAGWIGYCVAIALSIVLAAVSVWVLWTMGRWADRSSPPDDMRTTWPLRLMYWTAMVWPFVTLFGSGWLSREMLAMI